MRAHMLTQEKLWNVLLLKISHSKKILETILAYSLINLLNKLVTVRTTRALVKNTDSQPSSEDSDFLGLG